MSKKHACGLVDCGTKELFTFNQWLKHLLKEHGLYYKYLEDYIKVVSSEGKDK